MINVPSIVANEVHVALAAALFSTDWSALEIWMSNVGINGILGVLTDS